MKANSQKQRCLALLYRPLFAMKICLFFRVAKVRGFCMKSCSLLSPTSKILINLGDTKTMLPNFLPQ